MIYLMVVDPEQLEDFEPIKRGFNKQAYYGSLGTALVLAFLYFFITVDWPLENSAPWWGGSLYALGGCGIVYYLFSKPSGIILGMIAFTVYYLLVFFLLLISNMTETNYVFGILCLLMQVPVGGVSGWILAQAH